VVKGRERRFIMQLRLVRGGGKVSTSSCLPMIDVIDKVM
jgi:hypothetical protein